MEASFNCQCAARIMSIFEQCHESVKSLCWCQQKYALFWATRTTEEGAAENEQPCSCQLNFRRGWYILRRYNFPTSNEIAAVFVGENGVPPVNWDIMIYPNDLPTAKIAYISCQLDPMSYPLLFVHGEFGFHIELHVLERQISVHDKLTLQEFYKYRVAHERALA